MEETVDAACTLIAMHSCARLALVTMFLNALPASGHGNLDDLIHQADRRIDAHPDDVASLLDRAVLLSEHDEYERALADIRKVAEIQPDLHERQLVEARVRLRQGKPAEAIEILDVFIKARPEVPEAYSLRGKAKDIVDNGVGAIEDARRAIQVEKAQTLASHLNLIMLLRKHGTAAEVTAAFHDSRSKLGPVPSMLMDQAEWLGSIGQRDAASSIYAELRSVAPSIAFITWVHEFHLWSGSDNERANSARDQAELAWSRLSPSIRAKEPMIQRHDELRQPTP